MAKRTVRWRFARCARQPLAEVALATRLAAAVPAWLVVLAACGAPSEVSAPAARATQSPQPERDPTLVDDLAVSVSDPRLASMLRRVAGLRGLAFLRGVPLVQLSQAQMMGEARSQMRQGMPEALIMGQEAFLVGLGLVERDFEYRQVVLSLLGEHLAGLYDPRSGSMKLRQDLDRVSRRNTLAHELVHALQDQNFGLAQIMDWREGRGDAISARLALAEGGASSLMLDHQLGATQVMAMNRERQLEHLQLVSEPPPGAEMPGILWGSLLAPYRDGLALVAELRRRGGWTAVDEVWARPPETTEQLLHLDKWLGREPAESLPELPAFFSRRIYWDVVGEQGLRLCFEQWDSHDVARRAASGWGGDRLAVFRDGERWLLAWHLRWDDGPAAARGLTVFREALRRNTRKLRSSPVSQSAAHNVAFGRADGVTSECVARGTLGPLAVVGSGTDVAVIAGPFLRNSLAGVVEASCKQAIRRAQTILRE